MPLEEGLRRMADWAREAGVRDPDALRERRGAAEPAAVVGGGPDADRVVPSVPGRLDLPRQHELAGAAARLPRVAAGSGGRDRRARQRVGGRLGGRGARALPERPPDRAAPPCRLRREPQHRDPRHGRPLRLRPQRGHDERRLGLRADGRPPRRESARRSARAPARLSGRTAAGLRVALPVAGDRSARPAHARRARASSSRAAARPGTSTGRWRPRCSCGARRSTRSVCFDEEFFIYSEETDLCLRLRRAGWRTQYFPSVTVVHHESQFSAGIPERRINEMWRGRHRYWRSTIRRRAREPPRSAPARSTRCADCCGRATATSPARMRLHARDALPVRGPGLRELADEWNSEHAT